MEGLGVIRDRLTKNGPSLHIDRLPLKTRDTFVGLAKTDHCDDYGFTVKFLLDFYLGYFTQGNDELKQQVISLSQEVANLKADKDKEVKKGRTMMNGMVRVNS